MKQAKTVHEPLFHIVKRDRIPFWKSMAIRVLAVLAALAVLLMVAFYVPVFVKARRARRAGKQSDV